MKRLWNSLMAAIYTFKNPESVNNFRMIGDLYGLIFKVADLNRSMMAHIGFVNIETKDNHVLVSVWAGPGPNCSPVSRIEDLLKENAFLKKMLSDKIESENK